MSAVVSVSGTLSDTFAGSEAARWHFEPALRTRLLVMQATPFCNISCDYCYLAGRNDSRRMSREVVLATAQRLVESDLLDDALGVVWHAGEPLAAPIRFYETAFVDLARILGNRTRLQHSVQTNGTLINQNWCDLFQRWNVRVGVSLDGPAVLHDKHRRTRDNKPTHASVMRGIEVLQRADIPFHVIAVLTAESLRQADEIYDFFVAHGIHEVGFNVDEQEGVNATSSVADNGGAHAMFLRRILQRCMQAPGELQVRELEMAARLVMTPLPRQRINGQTIPDNSQVTPFSILCVAANGDYSTFSPELVDQRHPTHGPFVFGNVLRDPLKAMLTRPPFISMFDEVLAGIERCRETCQFFSFCGGGAPANKLAEHGSLASAETAYCRAVVQRPLELLIESCERPAARAVPAHGACP